MKLIKLRQNRYQVLEDNYAFEGSWADTYTYMVHDLDMDSDDIQFAMAEMQSKGHDTAHFGVNYLFTHTSQSVAVKHVLTELRTILELRREFHKSAQECPDSPLTRDTFNRLMSMYMAQNVEAALEALESVDEKKSA
jgi:hypothetical protein